MWFWSADWPFSFSKLIFYPLLPFLEILGSLVVALITGYQSSSSNFEQLTYEYFCEIPVSGLNSVPSLQTLTHSWEFCRLACVQCLGKRRCLDESLLGCSVVKSNCTLPHLCRYVFVPKCFSLPFSKCKTSTCYSRHGWIRPIRFLWGNLSFLRIFYICFWKNKILAYGRVCSYYTVIFV